jgi:hypothetical protein
MPSHFKTGLIITAAAVVAQALSVAPAPASPHHGTELSLSKYRHHALAHARLRAEKTAVEHAYRWPVTPPLGYVLGAPVYDDACNLPSSGCTNDKRDVQ